ncbi:hypothetical protein NDU88_000428 [Pleurodeles waltl]|uniref:Uncharacterized protein n=1 Tax=Pleurodeles waltl TaxID=8319 RepID=A0AAV7UR08_PLEWA|nr:hypothetical protein NDU88_000428 [Pleurodeles waltl]
MEPRTLRVFIATAREVVTIRDKIYVAQLITRGGYPGAFSGHGDDESFVQNHRGLRRHRGSKSDPQFPGKAFIMTERFSPSDKAVWRFHLVGQVEDWEQGLQVVIFLLPV